MQRVGVPLLLLCGAPGAGCSSKTVCRVAHLELDGIGYGPPGHSGSFEMKFRNVAAVWRSYSDAGAVAFVVSGLRALTKDVLACAAAVPGSVTTPVVLTVTPEEQRERILARAKTRYAIERGGASSVQTPQALERFVAAARQPWWR